MLTFFRRIRKGLLDGGATSKYLLYAIGEIALVVIGILIALQINNWNENRKVHQELNSSLEKMYKDLRLDSMLIQICKINYEKGYESGALLWSQLYEKRPLPETAKFIQRTQSIGRMTTFDLNNNQFSGMATNNSVKLISDDDLRDAIILYYTDEHIKFQLDLLRERTLRFHDMVVDVIPLEAHVSILKQDSISFITWAQQYPNIQYEILENLKENKDLSLALKNTIRSYLLCLREVSRKEDVNQYLRDHLKKYKAHSNS